MLDFTLQVPKKGSLYFLNDFGRFANNVFGKRKRRLLEAEVDSQKKKKDCRLIVRGAEKKLEYIPKISESILFWVR